MIWERMRIGRNVGHGREDNNFTLAAAKSVTVDISMAALLDLCLAENERHMSRYDQRLLRPRAVPKLARLTRRLVRAESAGRCAGKS
jgi:hypothetical protein